MDKCYKGLPKEFMTLLSVGVVDKRLLTKSTKKRKLAGRVVSLRINKARKLMKLNEESIPNYLSRSESNRMLLIYYSDYIRFQSKNFYNSSPWRLLRVLILESYGDVCMKCGSRDHIAVDHIKCRLYNKELELDPRNMQVLCRSCNSTKGARNSEDFRPKNWYDILTMNPSMLVLIRKCKTSNINGNKIGSTKSNTPDYLSITKDISFSKISYDIPDILSILKEQSSIINKKLKEIGVDSDNRFIGIETNNGWRKYTWKARSPINKFDKFLDKKLRGLRDEGLEVFRVNTHAKGLLKVCSKNVERDYYEYNRHL